MLDEESIDQIVVLNDAYEPALCELADGRILKGRGDLLVGAAYRATRKRIRSVGSYVSDAGEPEMHVGLSYDFLLESEQGSVWVREGMVHAEPKDTSA